MAAARFGDLSLRLGSGLVLAGVGLGAVWAGGTVFAALCALLAGLMIWELVSLLSPHARRRLPVVLAAAGAALVLVAPDLPPPWDVLDLLVISTLAVLLPSGQRRVFALAAVAIVLGAVSLATLRLDHAAVWTAWLILVVIASDVAGYFAGRLIGGPKFWPRVSPKKTWSGTVAGWALAAAVGWGVATWSGAAPALPLMALSVLVAFAAQMGDIGESWIKRRVGAKDASALLPGHGGAMDRFDGMIGASVLLYVLVQVFEFPAVLEG